MVDFWNEISLYEPDFFFFPKGFFLPGIIQQRLYQDATADSCRQVPDCSFQSASKASGNQVAPVLQKRGISKLAGYL